MCVKKKKSHKAWLQWQHEWLCFWIFINQSCLPHRICHEMRQGMKCTAVAVCVSYMLNQSPSPCSWCSLVTRWFRITFQYLKYYSGVCGWYRMVLVQHTNRVYILAWTRYWIYGLLMEKLLGLLLQKTREQLLVIILSLANTSFFSVLLSIISLFHEEFISGTAKRYLFLTLCRKPSSCALKNTNLLAEVGVPWGAK